jgi:hypothetical protein
MVESNTLSVIFEGHSYVDFWYINCGARCFFASTILDGKILQVVNGNNSRCYPFYVGIVQMTNKK